MGKITQKRLLNALKPGHQVHWHEIKEILGQGGFGITYLAQDRNLDHEIAIDAKPVTKDDLYAIVLAAGGSSRFGGIKQLLELDGRSLLKRAIDTATEVMDERVVLVLGLKANKLQREISQYNIETVINADWEKGMASSLKAGIKALPKNCKGALIVFCDQPLITEQHLQKLINTWLQDESKIIAGSYAETLGVPVLFPASYFPKILKLSGDRGAKSILHEYEDKVIPLLLPEAEVDIDTQEDVIEILKKNL